MPSLVGSIIRREVGCLAQPAQLSFLKLGGKSPSGEQEVIQGFSMPRFEVCINLPNDTSGAFVQEKNKRI